MPHPRDILIRILEQMRGHIVGGIDPHGAEFEDVEVLFMDAHPLLLEENRPRRIHLDGDAENEQQRRKHEHPAQGQQDGQQPLDAVTIHGETSLY